MLARLSSSRPPSERQLAAAVLDLALPGESPARAREAVVEVLAALRGRALVGERRRTLTAEGGRALRAMLGLGRTPTWLAIRDLHLPALALGLAPGSKQATEALRETGSLAAAVLRALFAQRSRVEATGNLVELAARVAAKAVCAPRPDRKSMARALGRRWVHEVTDPPGPRP